MTSALLFGFLNLFLSNYNFERLHIFLFNLSTGGTLILIFSENKRKLSVRTGLFLCLSFVYALSAFMKIYPPAIASAWIMALIVESIRIKRFSFFPMNFFSGSARVSDKFHHASLLCLSIGLIISSLVIMNQEYWRIILSSKLTLDVFFLGFSFPVSLITMSLMFAMMGNKLSMPVKILKNFSFWIINLGVIFFFIFILFQLVIAELVIAFVLFITVLIVFILYIRLGIKRQSKAFLSSGMTFLIMTAVTGIAYILFYVFIPQPPGGKLLLKIHTLVALYGWNLNGLAVISRFDDFPIQLHSWKIIFFHWIIVLIIAPLGFYFKALSIIAVIFYFIFLYIILFTKGTNNFHLSGGS